MEKASSSMSNGAGEGANQTRGNDFAFALARMAVAQICDAVEVNPYQESQPQEGLRFTSFQESALQTLTDVTVQYIQRIGKNAHSYANIAGRVEGNSLDIFQALEDLGSSLGFPGISDTDHCLANSGVVKDIIRYTGASEEIPFVYSLPPFPFNKDKRPLPSFSEIVAEPPDPHIPLWLPSFPETKLTDRSEETNAGTIQGNIPSIENGSSLDGGRFKSPTDAQKPTEGEAEGNPFLTAPLRFVENKVSPPVFRPLELSKEVVSINHVSNERRSNNHHIPVLETSAPSDEINKKIRFTEAEDEEKKDGASGRRQQTLVSFKIGTLKRPSCLAKNRSFQEQQGWFEEGEGKRSENGEKRVKELTLEL